MLYTLKEINRFLADDDFHRKMMESIPDKNLQDINTTKPRLLKPGFQSLIYYLVLYS
ncbi:MAG: hypothetical protein K0R50_3529 [Eubacterium sp.]|jgi:hypothetical protein|nr:hypothetical protein [Eubacterium sp.]